MTKPPLPALPPGLESRQLLDMKQAAVLTGYSVAHLRDLVRQGRAPSPVRLSARKLGFRAGDLATWIDSRVQKAGT